MCDVVALAKFIFRAAETRRIRYHRRRRDRAAPRRAAPRAQWIVRFSLRLL